MPQTAEDVVTKTGRQPAMPNPRSHPQWIAWAPLAAILWPVVYGAIRVRWAIHGAPSFGPLHFDLIYFTGWSAVGLCAAAALVSLLLRFASWRWPLLTIGWAVCAAHLIACPLLLLDIVGGLLPGMGVSFFLAAFMSRLCCLIQGGLVAASAVAYRRRWRSDCLFCGRRGFSARPDRPPCWAWCAAYAAIAGCLVRLGAQVAVGFGMLTHGNGTGLVVVVLVFEAGFLLAGIVLPLALVHTWGRIIPCWVPFFAGRRVPRWLPLGPAFVIGCLMTVYCGITLVKLTADTLGSDHLQSYGSLPLAFFWVAVPGYLIWGIGLGIAAIGYHRMTRPKCRACGT